MGNDPTVTDKGSVNRIRLALRGKREKPPAWVDAADLLAEDMPEYDWLAEDLLERQGRILLAGEEGSGKSLLALTAAVQAAAGKTVLETFNVSLPRRVVYFDLEMPRVSIQRRLRSLQISAGLNGSRGAIEFVIRPDGLPFDQLAEQREVMNKLNEIQPDIVVVDPLYKATRRALTFDEDVRPTLAALDVLRAELGCGLIIVHHLRKRAHGETTRGKDKSDIYGAGILLRWPETIFTMTEDTLRVHKDRDGHLEGIRSFNLRRGGIWPVTIAEATALPTEVVADFIRTMGPISGNQVAKSLGGRRQDIWDAMRTLENQGRIVKKGRDGWVMA